MQDKKQQSKPKPKNERDKEAISNNQNLINRNNFNFDINMNTKNKETEKIGNKNIFSNIEKHSHQDFEKERKDKILSKPSTKNNLIKNLNFEDMDYNMNYKKDSENGIYKINQEKKHNVKSEKIIPEALMEVNNRMMNNFRNICENVKESKFNNNENNDLNENKLMNHTSTSIYSYANRSTQLEYFNDLLNFMKLEAKIFNLKESNNERNNIDILNMKENEFQNNKNTMMNNNKNNKNNINNQIYSQGQKKTNHNKNELQNNKLFIDRYKFNIDISIRLTLNKFYNLYPIEYDKIIVDNLIFNKNCHLVSIFKDHMIFDYIDEFLKRFYSSEESKERIPKISNYYKNYLKFFCNPIFRDFKANTIIQGYGDYKAEIYYNKNYGKKTNNNENNDNNENNKFQIHQRKNKKGKIVEASHHKKIFDTRVKISIDRNSFITNNNSSIYSIKNQIFNESNFKYYILNDNNNNNNKQFDKKVCENNNDKYKDQYINYKNLRHHFETENLPMNNFKNADPIENSKIYNKNNEISQEHTNTSKLTNTILEFSQFEINNYCVSSNLKNNYYPHSNYNPSNVQISKIYKGEEIRAAIKYQASKFNGENYDLKTKKQENAKKRDSKEFEDKEDDKDKNEILNDKIIKNNIEKYSKNMRKAHENSPLNIKKHDNPSAIKFKNLDFYINKNSNRKDKDTTNVLFTNRSYDESILSLINCMDLDNEQKNFRNSNKQEGLITSNKNNNLKNIGETPQDINKIKITDSKSTNNIVNNQFSSLNSFNNSIRKTTIINKIHNLNNFNIIINNQFNLADITSNNTAIFNGNIISNVSCNNTSNRNLNSHNIPNNDFNDTKSNLTNKGNLPTNNIYANNKRIMEYNSKKQSTSNINNNLINNNNNNFTSTNSTISQKTKSLNLTNKILPSYNHNYNQLNIGSNKTILTNSNLVKTNLSKGDMDKFEKQHLNFTSNNDNTYTNKLNQNNNNLNSQGVNKFNNINLISKTTNNNNNITSNNINNNNNIKLTFSQDINSLKNIIEKNKILSRNKNQNLFQISSNQNNHTKQIFFNEEEIDSGHIANSKTNGTLNNLNFANTHSHINIINNDGKIASVLANLNKNNKKIIINNNRNTISGTFNTNNNSNNANLITNTFDKADYPLRDTFMQTKAFNSFNYKGKGKIK